MMLTAMMSLVMMAPPVIEYDNTTRMLTVTEVELALLSGPAATLVQGIPLFDMNFAFAGELKWGPLDPGVYEIMAWGPMIDGAPRESNTMTITVPDVDRITEIRALVNSILTSLARLRVLNPTGDEYILILNGE